MTPTINPRVQQIELSGIRKISNLVTNYPDAINLTIGQPDFPTPERIKEAAQQAIADDKTAYSTERRPARTQTSGIRIFRRQIRLHL